ncbi:hypothetical protein NOC27_2231 [Nitrosococcus oceani AFC27]|nr:hypothetical protein NOC27_2231 [Nitrosococcus oceani AFC27]
MVVIHRSTKTRRKPFTMNSRYDFPLATSAATYPREEEK